MVFANTSLPLPDPFDDHLEVLLQQDDVSRLTGNAGSTLHGKGDSGELQRRCVIDPLAQKPDGEGTLEYADDLVFLFRGDTCDHRVFQ